MEWRRSGSTCRTRTGNLKQPTRQDAINWVSAAWEAVAEDIVAHSLASFPVAFPTVWPDQRTATYGTSFPLMLMKRARGEEGWMGTKK